MAMRLSELLERIRPAGSPGSADSAESNVSRAAVDEIASIASVLRGFEDEAEAVLVEARARADDLRADGERRAQLVRDGAVERVAVASAEAGEADRTRTDDERRRIAEDAAVEIERRRARADAAREDLAGRVLETVLQLGAP